MGALIMTCQGAQLGFITHSGSASQLSLVVNDRGGEMIGEIYCENIVTVTCRLILPRPMHERLPFPSLYLIWRRLPSVLQLYLLFHVIVACQYVAYHEIPILSQLHKFKSLVTRMDFYSRDLGLKSFPVKLQASSVQSHPISSTFQLYSTPLTESDSQVESLGNCVKSLTDPATWKHMIYAIIAQFYR